MNDPDISSNYNKQILDVGNRIMDNKNGTSNYSNEKCQNGGYFNKTLGYNVDETDYYTL